MRAWLHPKNTRLAIPSVADFSPWGLGSLSTTDTLAAEEGQDIRFEQEELARTVSREPRICPGEEAEESGYKTRLQEEAARWAGRRTVLVGGTWEVVREATRVTCVDAAAGNPGPWAAEVQSSAAVAVALVVAVEEEEM